MSTNEINQNPQNTINVSEIDGHIDAYEREQEVARQQKNKIYMKLDAFKYSLNDAKKVAYNYSLFIANNVNLDNLITDGMSMNAISDAFLLEFAKRGQRLDYPESEKLNTEPVTYVRPSNFEREHFVYDKVTGGYSQIMYDS